jgi:hypothetical protein
MDAIEKFPMVGGGFGGWESRGLRNRGLPQRRTSTDGETTSPSMSASSLTETPCSNLGLGWYRSHSSRMQRSPSRLGRCWPESGVWVGGRESAQGVLACGV